MVEKILSIGIPVIFIITLLAAKISRQEDIDGSSEFDNFDFNE